MDDTYTNGLRDGGKQKLDRETANSYKIQCFDPKSVSEKPGCISITAMTGAGKTVLIKDLLYHNHKAYDSIYVISRTAKAQPIYDFIPRENIIDKFDETFLTELWQTHFKKKEMDNKVKLDSVLIIMDDIINDREYKSSKIIDDFFTGGRHYNFSIWFLTQNFVSLRPLQRRNVRWAISFDLDAKTEREKFSQSYLSAVNDRVGELLFSRIVKETPFQCIVVEVHKNGVRTEDKVKKYIANENVPKFKVAKVKRISRPGVTGTSEALAVPIKTMSGYRVV